jgi:hypothetical protein
MNSGGVYYLDAELLYWTQFWEACLDVKRDELRLASLTEILEA